jgi:hypothetical protein
VTNRPNVHMRLRTCKLLFGHSGFSDNYSVTSIVVGAVSG